MRESTRISFHISVYNSPIDTDRFHPVALNLSRLSAQAEPTVFHTFMDKVVRDGRLLRHYTQNIDYIEQRLPDLRGETVQLHGRTDQAICQSCGWNILLV